MKNILFKWVDGQHQTGYSILTLAWVAKWTPVPFDCYIIKYPTGSYIPPHRDKLKTRDHYRVNVIFSRGEGGEFICKNTIFRSKWLNVFRPDLEEHSVTPVTKGTRYVFSIGWALRRKSTTHRSSNG